MAGAQSERRALRTIEVECPAWAEGVTRIREPRIRDFLAASKFTDEQEKTVALLGAMVLGPDGQPVGRDAILDASVPALLELSEHIGPLVGEVADPLDRTSDSATASPSPSGG